MIKQRGVQPESENSLSACLGRLVNYKDGSPIPEDTVAVNAGLFFGAGYETTAHAITWALFELAADTSIQVSVFNNNNINKFNSYIISNDTKISNNNNNFQFMTNNALPSTSCGSSKF